MCQADTHIGFNLELNLSVKHIHWFTQKNMKTFEALVIAMNK